MKCSATGDKWPMARGKASGPCHASRVARHAVAFTLVEVMVALLIFFMAVFTVLGLLSNSLRNARSLQRKRLDCGLVAAQTVFQLGNTNQVPEDVDSGDFGDLYPDYEWTTDTREVQSNGLYQVDMIVQRKGGAVESSMSILIFPQNARGGSLDRGVAR